MSKGHERPQVCGGLSMKGLHKNRCKELGLTRAPAALDAPLANNLPHAISVLSSQGKPSRAY
eukprot:12919948-Prorocentrum_lima.AAC.1